MAHIPAVLASASFQVGTTAKIFQRRADATAARLPALYALGHSKLFLEIPELVLPPPQSLGRQVDTTLELVDAPVRIFCAILRAGFHLSPP